MTSTFKPFTHRLIDFWLLVAWMKCSHFGCHLNKNLKSEVNKLYYNLICFVGLWPLKVTSSMMKRFFSFNKTSNHYEGFPYALTWRVIVLGFFRVVIYFIYKPTTYPCDCIYLCTKFLCDEYIKALDYCTLITVSWLTLSTSCNQGPCRGHSPLIWAEEWIVGGLNRCGINRGGCWLPGQFIHLHYISVCDQFEVSALLWTLTM